MKRDKNGRSVQPVEHFQQCYTNGVHCKCTLSDVYAGTGEIATFIEFTKYWQSYIESNPNRAPRSLGAHETL